MSPATASTWCAPRTAASISTCRRARCEAKLGTLKQNAVSITNPSYPDPYGGLSPQAFVTVTARPNVSIIDDKIRNMSGDTVTAGISQQLRPNLAIHVDGVYTNLRDFARTQNINQPRPMRSISRRSTRRPPRGSRRSRRRSSTPRARLANWGNVTQLASNGWSNYRALYVRLDKRMSNRYMYLVSYTRDWTTNNVANISDFYHPELQTGP